jgi:hypothetical protein
MEAFLAEALARADASSAVAGGGTPPQLPSPLLESLPLPSAVLGPEFCRLDQAFATVDPRFLHFESDEDILEGGSVSPPPPASSAVDGSGAVPMSPGIAEVPRSPPPPQVAPELGDILSDAEIERRVEAALGPLYPPPPPAPYTDGAPGASLWNPDVDVVSIDTVHPQDMPLAADVLSLSCVLAQRTRDISHRYAEDTHDTFIAKPSRLSEGNTLPVPPPSPGTEARDIFPAQPPHIVAWEVRAVEHMLLTAGHWLTTVNMSSVPLHKQQGLFELAAAAFVVAGQRLPSARAHEPSCPLSHEADMMPPPSPMGGGGLHRTSGAPLPLAVAPRGMSRRPCLCVLVVRGAQLSAELHAQLSSVVLGGGWWRTCVASSFPTGWATRCASCWGAVPLGLVRRGGF